MEGSTERFRGCPGESRWSSRRGLTVIELVIVVVILVILAAIAYPRIRDYRSGRSAAAAPAVAVAGTDSSGMEGDLRRVAAAQQAYAARTHAYAADLAALGVTPSAGVQIAIGGAGLANGSGWNATATSTRAPGRTCYAAAGADSVVSGTAVAPGAVVCR